MFCMLVLGRRESIQYDLYGGLGKEVSGEPLQPKHVQKKHARTHSHSLTHSLTRAHTQGVSVEDNGFNRFG